MARFYGAVGYGESVEDPPDSGAWKDKITEYNYYGDVVRNTRRSEGVDQVNNDISVGNLISIVADAYARSHIFAIRYVAWQGTLWHVTEVEVQSPRLLLTLGGVYNGPIPVAPPSTP